MLATAESAMARLANSSLWKRPRVDVLVIAATIFASWLASLFEIVSFGLPWFPPAAIMLWFLCEHGLSGVGTVLVGRLIAELIVYPSAFNSVSVTSQTMLKSVLVVFAYTLGAIAIRERVQSYERVREVGWFMAVGCVFAPGLAALLGATVAYVAADTTLGSFGRTLRVGFIGDAIAVASIAPVLFRLSGRWHRDVAPDRSDDTSRINGIEAAAQAAAIVVVPLIAFASGGNDAIRPYLALSVLPVLWVGLRASSLTAQIASFLTVTSLAIVARWQLGKTDDLVGVQAVMLAASFATLYATSVVRSQRRRFVFERDRAVIRSRRDRTDGATGMANELALREALTSPDSHGSSVIAVAIDRFASIADGIGAEQAKRLLVEVSERITQAVGPSGLVGHLDSERFAVIAPRALGYELGAIAAEILDAIRRQPFLTTAPDLLRLPVTVSAGLATPVKNPGTVDLLRDAEVAVRVAQSKGGHCISEFDESFRENAIRRQTVVSNLRQALDQGSQLSLAFQPIIELSTGRLAAGEALLRWTLPTGESISPGEFIPLAEQSGLMLEVGDFVLREAVAQLGRWEGMYADDFRLHVNLSPRQLADIELPSRVASLAEAAGVPTKHLCLELTETDLAVGPELAMEALARLSDCGVHLALDDFGTGFSTIGWLSRFPIDTLKIDQTFVAGIPNKADDVSIVRLIVELSRDLHLEVTAEGIESSEQLAMLSAFGCPLGQGYLLAKPMRPDDFGLLLQGARPWADKIGKPDDC
jgi:EAL domain-containing protein (putative c-di-GMP-specific phosphodiesterase class I)/GGDEF domain-containing protein